MVVGGERDAKCRTDRFDALIRNAQNSTALCVREVLKCCCTGYLHENAVRDLLLSEPGMHSGNPDGLKLDTEEDGNSEAGPSIC
jgi:hypothetical protein